MVTDTSGGGKEGEDPSIAPSTISRFACRVVCERNPPYTARIYAAGFDSSKNIFLGVSRLTIKPPEVFNKEYIFGIRTNLLKKHLILVWNYFAVTNHLHFDREPFLCLHICATTGESNQMEKPWWAHGRPDHQRGASDAPGGVPRGPQAGSVEGDFSLWRCLCPAGDALWTQPGQTGESTLFLLAWSRFARFDFGLILVWFWASCLCINLYRQRARAVHYVTVPWLTCVVPPCCGGPVRGWCVLPLCVTWKRFARNLMHPGPSVL